MKNAVCLAAALLLALPTTSTVQAQSSGGTGARAQPAPALDLSRVRRAAAELAEIRAILNDPAPDVRLLAMQEIALRGSATQRQVALEVGLASPDAVFQETALRLLAAGFRNVLLPFVNDEGQPLEPRNGWTHLIINFEAFEAETGKFTGNVPNGCNNALTGQLSGNVMTFTTNSGVCSGTLRWNVESREFAGIININWGQLDGNRRVIWRPM